MGTATAKKVSVDTQALVLELQRQPAAARTLIATLSKDDKKGLLEGDKKLMRSLHGKHQVLPSVVSSARRCLEINVQLGRESV